MKLYSSAMAVLGLLASLLFDASAKADDPTFEQIEVLTTSLEPWGQSMVNRGDGYFYGVARWAQNQQCGAIYRIAPHQPAEILYTFPMIPYAPYVNVGGCLPSSGLVLGPDGALYGANQDGGANGYGTIYRFSADGVYSVIHDFVAAEGSFTNSLVFSSSGELYGTTQWGGSRGGGTLFRVGTDGVFQLLYSFSTILVAGESVSPSSPIALH